MKILPGTVQKLEQILSNRGSSTAFSNKVEKHLDDYRKGKGNLSRDTAQELSTRDISTAFTLGSLDPNALRTYSSYASALTYDQKARYTQGISSATTTAVQLENLKRLA